MASPVVSLGDPDGNADAIIALAQRADADSAALLLLPELCVSGYAIEDLLMQEALLDSVEDAIAKGANADPLHPENDDDSGTRIQV